MVKRFPTGPVALRVGDRADLTSDRRSAQAFLHGRDDGRTVLYVEFCKSRHSTQPDLDDELMAILFSRFESDTYYRTRALPYSLRPEVTLLVMRARLWLVGCLFRLSPKRVPPAPP